MAPSQRMYRNDALKNLPGGEWRKRSAVYVVDFFHRRKHLRDQQRVFAGIVPLNVEFAALKRDRSVGVVPANSEQVRHMGRVASVGAGRVPRYTQQAFPQGPRYQLAHERPYQSGEKPEPSGAALPKRCQDLHDGLAEGGCGYRELRSRLSIT